MNEFLNSLDHPVVFVFLMAIAIACALAVMTAGAKAAGLPGPAALFQHP